jgi:predicted NAD/FAD-dependent oxidoreductase
LIKPRRVAYSFADMRNASASNGPSPRIIVAGTGPVGLIAALALADTGLTVTLVGPGPCDGVRAQSRRHSCYRFHIVIQKCLTGEDGGSKYIACAC